MSKGNEFLISGYFVDDKSTFKDYVVREFDEVVDEDENVFFYGLSEETIKRLIETGDSVENDFVITSYKKQ